METMLKLQHACLIGLTAALLLLPALPGQADPPPPHLPPDLSPCGMGDLSIPDFTLIDQIPGSPTYNQSVSLTDYAGQVLLIYWMDGN